MGWFGHSRATNFSELCERNSASRGALVNGGVLEEVGNHEARVGKPTKRETTWAQHGGKVDTHDAKARMRHLEAVRARIMRARGRDKESLVRGRE